MIRTIGVSALTLGALLAFNGVASAADESPTKSSMFGATMTLGGHGTPAQAASDDDTELTYYRGGYGGYRGGYYGGYRGGYYGGYRGGYYGGYRGGYYGGYGGYRGGYYGGYRPYYGGYGLGLGYGGFGYGSYYRPAFPAYYGGYSGYSSYSSYNSCNYYGISGTAEDANAPVISLNMTVANSPVANPNPTPPTPVGGLRYDGGPSNPVPLPDVAPKSQADPTANGLPVSLSKAKATSPYTFKAYGEK